MTQAEGVIVRARSVRVSKLSDCDGRSRTYPMQRTKMTGRPRAKIMLNTPGASGAETGVAIRPAKTTRRQHDVAAEAVTKAKPEPPLDHHAVPADLLEAIRLAIDPLFSGSSAPKNLPDVAHDLAEEFKQVLFETLYLQSCSDVASAVKCGTLASGYAHWLERGRTEILERNRTLFDVPTPAEVIRRAGKTLRHPDTRAILDYVDDWQALLLAFSAGVAYHRKAREERAPAEQPVVEPVYRHVGPSVAAWTVQHVTTPGLERYYDANPQVVAFYLPQYHRVRENDEWWGEGFTEWTNVRKAKPNFEGHFQPRVPLGRDYYDLADSSVQQRQCGLAKEYGIRAFCYYLYWFDGRRLLERPLDQMLEDKSIDHEFCVCWANENWTRTWDGKANDILLGQIHTPESDRRFILDSMKYLLDPRYMRVDGKLMLLVYRVDLLPNASATAAIWREEVLKAGLGELHLCAVQFYGVTDPAPWGFDAAVEFPPHGWLGQENLMTPQPTITNPDFKGYIFDYDKCVDWAMSKSIPDYRWYRGAFPGWDNTARRQDTPHIFANSNPFSFERWLTAALRQSIIMAPPEHQIVFVNAWNEWGEGAHLEPDEAGGHFNLMALNSALKSARDSGWVLALLGRLRTKGDYPERTADELNLLNHLRGHEQALRALSDRLRAGGVNPYV